MEHFDRTRTPSRSSVPTETRVVDKQDMRSRFSTDFSKVGAKCAAPVQSEVSGWQDYLSRRELADYDRARLNIGLGGAAAMGLFLAKTGAVLFLTASVVPAFSLVMGAAAAVAGTYGLASWAKAVRIQKRGERRESDAEVAARQVGPGLHVKI